MHLTYLIKVLLTLFSWKLKINKCLILRNPSECVVRRKIKNNLDLIYGYWIIVEYCKRINRRKFTILFSHCPPESRFRILRNKRGPFITGGRFNHSSHKISFINLFYTFVFVQAAKMFSLFHIPNAILFDVNLNTNTNQTQQLTSFVVSFYNPSLNEGLHTDLKREYKFLHTSILV